MNKRFERLKQRAEAGDAAAQWKLSQYYCRHPEWGGLYDWIDWARKAAEQGHPEAEICVGEFCDEHYDEPQAAMWFERAVMHGCTRADYYRGFYYMEGRGGLPVDLQQAKQCFLRASDIAEAAYAYYLCYRRRLEAAERDGKRLDEEEEVWAIRLLRQSADDDYAPALYTLGMLYKSANRTEKALACLKAAARKGYDMAIGQLCTMYAQQCLKEDD